MASKYKMRMVKHLDGIRREKAVIIPDGLNPTDHKIFVESNGDVILIATKVRQTYGMGLAEAVQYMRDNGMFIHHADKKYERKTAN